MPWGCIHGVTEELTRKEPSRALRPWREKYPQVEAESSIRLTSLAKVAVHADESAALLVVGRRVHRHGTTHHLDHVAHAAIHHGRCPVTVVPHA
ncbi:universal stress protein [Streptomyces brasiliscabiei]|uniref:Universal stress protein n=1 Tax=Streptomyces brasiliscabiei TaxID=2736302 RepID=A0ABU8GL32_9ACTN